jgi:hypothetical protein
MILEELMDNLFTAESFLTLSSCVAAVWLIVNVLRHATGWGPRWVGLLISLIVAGAAFFATGAADASAGSALWLRILAGVVNAFLIYSAAFGIQQTVSSKPEGAMSDSQTRVTFRTGW